MPKNIRSDPPKKFPRSRPFFGIIHSIMKRLIPLSACFAAFSAVAAMVSDVQFKALDNFGGDVGSVASRCQTRKGAVYNPVAVTRDINALKASGEFEEITADVDDQPSGVKVIFNVRRKLRFAPPLVVKGAEFFSESKIADEAGLKDGYLYGDADLAAAAARIKHLYVKKNFAQVKVNYFTRILSGNDAEVTFTIVEGERHKVAGFAFEGADHAIEAGVFKRNADPFFELGEGEFNAVELHDAINDFAWWDYNCWFTDSPVTGDQLAQCCDKLAEVYRNHGYLDVKVTGPKAIPSEDDKVNYIFTIVEGPQYRVGNISIRGLKSYKESDVAAQAQLPPAGEIAAQKLLDDAAQRIKVVVGSGDNGLADTAVNIKRIPSEVDPSVVDIVFDVKEGVPVTINDVIIRGNDYTKDNVIRREIALGPGDRMLEDRADRSQRRLENLDYFSRVRYYLETTDLGKAANGSEYRNLVYEVEEKNTGSFMIGIGASSVDSVYVTAEVNQNNFDLFAPSKLFRGAGQKGRASVAWGPRYQTVELGFVEPYFLARQLELSVDLYRRLRWYDQYDLVRSGGMASLSYPVKFWPTWGTFGRLGFGLSGEYIEMEDVEHGTYYTSSGRECSFDEEKRKYSGTFEPVLHLFWARDTRDNFRVPTKGMRTRVFVDVSPAGDNQYWRLGFNHRHYFPVWKRYNHVFMVGLRAETIAAFSDDVPIYNRMFLGGPKSIRGIEYRHVGPMVHKEDSNSWEPWGGQTLAVMNLEYTIPIVKMFRLALFSDLGSVGEDEFDFDLADNFAWTAGVGLRLDIPMFPIRLDFGFPIEKPDHADKEAFSFTVGYDL